MEDFESTGYSINIDMVAKDKNSLAVTRMLAKDLMENPYMTVADFMTNISNKDLEQLVQGMDDEFVEEFYGDYILIAEMLATAEGCPAAQNEEEVSVRIEQLITLLCVESLGRKGLCKVFRENMSFHEDMKDKSIAEKL